MKLVYYPRVNLARRQLTEGLRSIPGLDLVIAPDAEAVLAALPDADALVTSQMPFEESQPIVDSLKAPGNTVRWLHLNSAGQDGWAGVGLPESITATNAAGAVAPTVAEHAMALALAVARQVPTMVRNTDRRQWDRSQISPRMISLEGATMAIIGFGHIGKALATRAKAFGMRVTAVSRTVANHPMVDEALGLDALPDALARADVIVIAIALTPQTHHLIGARELARCKPSAILVNVARGAIVDEAALRDALDNDRLAGAALDTTALEPLPESDPLWGAKNAFISPHAAAGGSTASLNRIAAAAADNARRYLAGEPLLNIVAL